MNTTDELTQLNAALAAQTRAYLEAAERLGLQIGHLTPEQAMEYIIEKNLGEVVANTARHLYAEVFNLKTL